MGAKKSVTVGYRYYIGMHQVYAMSPDDFPVQAVERIRAGEQTVWTGSITANGTAAINAPNAFGGEKKEGGVVGNVNILFGGAAQGINDYLQAKLTGQPLPAFRGILSLVLRQVYVAAMNPYLKPWAIFARRNLSPYYSAKSAIGADMNPAHIIYDALTSTQYGLSVSAGRVDDASFQSVADTLYSEGFGLSVFWQSDRQPAEDFIGGILEIVDGSLYEDQASGKWRLKLAREDYTPAELPIFDTGNIVRVERFSQPLPGDLASEVIVNFRDRESGKPGSVPVQDIAVLAIQGGVPVRVTRDMDAIPTSALASKVAARELRQLATPLAKATLIVNRQAWNLNIGEVFRFQWAPYGIQDMVMRVAGIGRGTLTNGRIRVECVQDIFSAASAIYAPPPASAWTSPVSTPAASPSRLVIEAPYWVVVREIVGESPTLLGEIDPLAGLLLSAGSRPSGDAYDYRLYTRAGSAAYADRGAGSFCPVAELTAAVGKADTIFGLANEIDTDLVAADTWASINGEIVKVKSITAGSVTVARGVLDTLPAEHAAGSKIFFADIHKAVDTTEWASGQTVNAKLLTRTGLGTLDEASAPADSLVLAQRFIRPYPPGNLLVNGSAYPEWIDGQADLALTWAHRDRTLQTAYLVEQSEGNIGPELGQTYTLRIYGESDNLIKTEAGFTGTSYTYTTEAADSGLGTGGGVAYRYWRIYITANNGDTYTAIGEGEFVDTTGAVVDYAGMPTNQSSYYVPNGSTAAKMVDGSFAPASNAWVSDGSALPQWVSFDFTSPVAIATVKLATENHEVGPGRAPKDFQIQGSDDGLAWTTIVSFTNQTGWPIGSSADAYVEFAVQPSSARRNGKLRFELESVRDGHVSWQKYNHTVLREGYGFNYGYYYGGK